MESSEHRSVITFLYLQGKFPFDIFQEIVQMYGEKSPRYDTVTYWVRKFKSVFMSLIGEDREGSSLFVVTEDNVTIVKKLLQDKRLTVKQVSNETGIIVGSIELILLDHHNMNKVSAELLPLVLINEQKKQRNEHFQTPFL